jgi:hypothetical protein
MIKKSQEYFTNFKEKLHISDAKGCEFVNDLSFSNEEQKEARRSSTELKVALIALCVSCIIVCSKVVLMNRSLFKKFYTYSRTYWATSSFGTYQLISDDSRTKITELLLTSTDVVRETLEHPVTWLLCPVLAGLGMTVLTWYVIYTDSCIPGVKPPTPFSPTKNRRLRSPRVHFAYIVAVLNGILLFLLMVFTSQ